MKISPLTAVMIFENIKIDIENIKSKKDLGVILDYQLKFNEHIAQKVKKLTRH